jgi:alpha-1,2-mannosyltransferase
MSSARVENPCHEWDPQLKQSPIPPASDNGIIALSFFKSSWYKRFWLAGGGVFLFVLTLVVGNCFIRKENAVTGNMLGHDFLAFYSAGSLVREGKTKDLYDLPVIKKYEHELIRREKLEVGETETAFGPWWNPPFYAWVFVPLAAMPYHQALLLWTGINVLCLLLSLWLLSGMVRGPEFPRYAPWLVPLLILPAMPIIQAFSHGQNTCTSLLLLTLTVTLWRGNKNFLAGVVGGLLFYKPQLGAVLAVILVLTQGWRALAGLLLTGLALLGITLLTLPGMLEIYRHQLPANVHYMQIEHPYLWDRHVTLLAFFRLLFQGKMAGEHWLIVKILTYGLIAIAGIGLLGAALRRWKLRTNHFSPDRLIAATIAAMPLLMPFYFDYDLLLLAVPAVLYGAEAVRAKTPDPTDPWIPWAWCFLYLWLALNPTLAGILRVNVTVILLVLLAGLLLRRAWTENAKCEMQNAK